MIWIALSVGLVVVVGGVLVVRLHAFLALLLAALAVAMLTPPENIIRSHWKEVSAIVGDREVTAFSQTKIVDGEDGPQRDYRAELTVTPGKDFEAYSSLYESYETDDDLLTNPGSVVMPAELLRLSSDGDLHFGRLVAVDQEPVRSIMSDDAIDSLAALPEGTRLVAKADMAALYKLASRPSIAHVVDGFASTAGKIGILIAMAAIIGVCLLESGAAERIVLATQAIFGERYTALGLVVASFVLAIPVFFDTVFFLMLPIAQALARRTGRDYLKYVLSIVVGGTLAHSLVPPTPGPLFVASELGVSLLDMFLGGIGVGLWGVAAGYLYLLWANRRYPVGVPVMLAEDIADDAGQPLADRLRSPGELPRLWISLLPIVLPIACLGFASIAANVPQVQAIVARYSWAGPAVEFVGDKNIALMIAAAAALLTLVRRPGLTRKDGQAAVGRALADGGTVILITCAGGAFGHVIRQTDIASELAATFPDAVSGVSLLVAAFVLTAVIRVAQGSATVAMITAVGITAPLVSSGLPYHPVYVALAIGCGSKPLPWMNDSGFWTISKMAGLTEGETLRTFTVLLTIMGFVAFGATLLGAIYLPLV